MISTSCATGILNNPIVYIRVHILWIHVQSRSWTQMHSYTHVHVCTTTRILYTRAHPHSHNVILTHTCNARTHTLSWHVTKLLVYHSSKEDSLDTIVSSVVKLTTTTHYTKVYKYTFTRLDNATWILYKGIYEFTTCVCQRSQAPTVKHLPTPGWLAK